MPPSWLTGSKERLCGDLNLLGERASLPHQDIGRNMRLSVAFDNITEMQLQRLIDESETPGLPLLTNADFWLTTYDQQ
jgi:hypothetical protein